MTTLADPAASSFGACSWREVATKTFLKNNTSPDPAWQGIVDFFSRASAVNGKRLGPRAQVLTGHNGISPHAA
jgi:hypothetical protein